MENFKIEQKNKIVRGAKRGTYDKKEIFEILDAGFICHLSWVINDQPFIIPTAYARDGETIYVHGSVKSRMVQAVKEGIPVCLSVTHLDGLVLARSAFHHSVNYRSVVVFGTATEVDDIREKDHALFLITENILEGRWDECRKPNDKELSITSVLAIKIENASAKIRKGDPVDDAEDYELEHWAGVLPIKTVFQEPVSDSKLKKGIETGKAVTLAWKKAKG